MITEEHGVAGASPCECRNTFFIDARASPGWDWRGRGGRAGEKWGSLCHSSVAWPPFHRETEAASHLSFPHLALASPLFLEGSDLGSSCDEDHSLGEERGAHLLESRGTGGGV